jgi:hypothetical protein
MSVAVYWWRATRRRSWRAALAVALIGGLLGAVAFGALAGARRTASAYGRYLQSINSSDVFVNIPAPEVQPIPEIAALPGVRSGAAWLGLNANPVVRGHIDDSFLDNGLEGSFNGEYFRQDRMTVLAGTLPGLGATGQIALTAQLARVFGVGVGGHVTYQFYQLNLRTGVTSPGERSTFLVTAIVETPPVLTDQFDEAALAVLPPAATARYRQANEFSFSWVGLRLRTGEAGIPAVQRQLAVLGTRLGHQLEIRRLDTIHREVQQAIAPQAIAVAIFGALAALAMLILVGQALTQMLSRSAAQLPVLQAVGATRVQAAMAVGLEGAMVVMTAVVLSVAGAVAVSPLAPVGPVRQFDPARGVEADPLVLGGGAAAMVVVLLGLLTVLAWRSVRQAGGRPPPRPSVIARAAAASGLPVTAVVGTRLALERGSGRRPATVRGALFGSIAAVTAVVMALVFGASLTGLAAHPVRYGWNWTLLMDSEGGFGNWQPATMAGLIDHQPGVIGWSAFGFTQVPIDGQEIPVLGLQRYLGSVAPPTTSGHPIAGPGQIELGTITLRQLGKHVGDQVTVGTGRTRRDLTIVGTVTLPSIGVILTDHVSLGRGAMLPQSTLLAIQGVRANGAQQPTAPVEAAFPSAAAIDLVRNATDARLLAGRIAAASPDGSPGGTYALGPQIGAAVSGAAKMGSQPLTLALALAAAAVLSLVLTVLASVRRRRQELALLKTLGLRRRQVRAVVGWQTTTILIIAAAVGMPLGIAAGRWAWVSFANSIGVVPVAAVPVPALALGFVVLLAAGNLLAAGPATVAARIAPAVALRAE